jgi:hypothetical protein
LFGICRDACAACGRPSHAASVTGIFFGNSKGAIPMMTAYGFAGLVHSPLRKGDLIMRNAILIQPDTDYYLAIKLIMSTLAYRCMVAMRVLSPYL